MVQALVCRPAALTDRRRFWARHGPSSSSGKAGDFNLGRGIAGIRELFEVDRVRRRAQRTILAFSIAYNLCAVGLAATGRVNPLVAAVLKPTVSLLTVAIVLGGMRPVFRIGFPRPLPPTTDSN